VVTIRTVAKKNAACKFTAGIILIQPMASGQTMLASASLYLRRTIDVILTLNLCVHAQTIYPVSNHLMAITILIPFYILTMIL
jgi:hypothetical protein